MSLLTTKINTYENIDIIAIEEREFEGIFVLTLRSNVLDEMMLRKIVQTELKSMHNNRNGIK